MRIKNGLINDLELVHSSTGNWPTAWPIRRTSRGQALIELAVFGAIFLMIMGAMLSYGLRYNFVQQANQQAFRSALKIASDPGRGSGSYTLITDKHIPDPVDPFGVGSSIPVMASASVMRSPQLDASPQMSDLKDDLPTSVVDIQESRKNGVTAPLRRMVYTNAGFRWEYAVGDASSSGGGGNIIGGSDNVIVGGASSLGGGSVKGGSSGTIARGGASSTGGASSLGGSPSYSQNQVNKYRLLYGGVDTMPGEKPVTKVRITDSCSGEVTDLASCYEQATRLVDNDACYKYCTEVNSSGDINCATICSDAVLLNPPNQVDPNYHSGSSGGPWYAAGYVRHSPDSTHFVTWYTFPVLDQLFGSLGSGAMGFQPAGDKEQYRNTSVRRIETPGDSGAVLTDESVVWSDKTNKNFVYHDNLDPSTGDELSHPTASEYTDSVVTNTFVSEVSGNTSDTWTTGKQE